MRNHFEFWCETIDFSLSEIDRRASLEVEAGHFPTLIFISLDLYAELQKSMASYSRQSGPLAGGSSIMSVTTSAAGSLNIKPVNRLRNFLMVGRNEEFEAFVNSGIDPIFWNDQERVRVDKAFEDLLILEGGNET